MPTIGASLGVAHLTFKRLLKSASAYAVAVNTAVDAPHHYPLTPNSAAWEEE